MIVCIVPDCSRARRQSPSGAIYAMCDAHTCAALTDAFGDREPRSWSERAAAHTLPSLVVGGVPIETVTTARSALEPGVPTPLAPLVPSAERAALAAPTG